VVLAWLALLRARSFDIVVTDGEHIGIPLALMLKAASLPIPHVTIGHRLSARKKRPFFRVLGAHSHISRIVLHSHRQWELASAGLGIPPDRLTLLPYHVDTAFWRPQPVAEERLVVSAGLEHRDYPTLFRAVEGMDIQVVIGAASYWARRPRTAESAPPPPNVQIGAYDYVALRALYARAAVVVVPLVETDFQAGVTTILEAMAMGKAVVVTHTQGQTDVVEDRRATTRGDRPRTRPPGMLKRLAQEAGIDLAPSGCYVMPGDAAALRATLQYLLDDPGERHRLGAAGRRTVEQLTTTTQFAARLHALIEQVSPPRRVGASTPAWYASTAARSLPQAF
jgi:glycosyltransferase involved in cell wall biosynthesis